MNPVETIVEKIDTIEDLPILLSTALLLSQGVEFGLYGIAAHLSHTDVAQKDKRFKDLNPETFLRGDPSDLKASLGQLVELWGDLLMIKTDRLVKYYQDRNLIIHNYRRVFMMEIKGNPPRTDGVKFLRAFIVESSEIKQILLGLVYLMGKAIAIKEGREKEIQYGEKEDRCIKAYHQHAIKYKVENSSLEELIEFFIGKPK